MEVGGSGGILREVECRVCGDKASGKHYGVPSCDGCRGFFKRSIRRNLDYVCKESGNCIVDVTRRNQCQSCRFKKCLKVNMKRDAVQHERAPRTNPIGKSRIPFQSFNPTTTSTSLYFQPHFKHPSTSCGGGGGFYTGFHHSNFQSRIIFSPPQFPRSSSLIPNETTSNFKQEKGSRGEEEVSTTTNNEQLIESKYNTPSPNMENIYESAAKLLFLSIKWARSVPSFGGLSASDQATLLENSWAEIFLLSAVQWGIHFEDTFLLGKNSSHLGNARRLMDVLSRIGHLNPDHTELACLKAVVLFKPVSSLTSELRVEILQDQTLLMLQEYTNAKSPLHKLRFGKLLLIFPTLKSISSSDLEELFFKHTVGEVSIQKLISDLVKSTF